MKGSFNDSRLQILSAQLASMRASEPENSFLVRAVRRIEREFLRRGVRDKLRFARYAVRESMLRAWHRLRPRQQPMAKVAIPHVAIPHVAIPPNRLLIAAKCNGGWAT